MSTFFVLIKNASDYYRLNYSDILHSKDVLYIDNPVSGKNIIMQKLHRIHNSMLINRFVNLPFKRFWFPYYLKNHMIPNNNVCFVFDVSPFYLTTYMFDYFKYIKRLYPKAKYVLYYQDIISLCPEKYRPNNMKDLFDLIITYDRNESINYNILYHPTVGSRISVDSSDDIIDTDVYLLAKAKNRLPLIIEVYDALSEAGLTCDFFVTEVQQKDRVFRNGIHYLDTPMKYIDNIRHVTKTKCILEIIQNNAVGYSLRLWEAILYNKMFLTNNQGMYKSEFYDERYVSIFDTAKDINKYCEYIKQGGNYQNPFKKSIGPRSLLNFIENNL